MEEDNPLWFKDAVFYEIHVRTFYDSSGDGIGDFRGLTIKLDYLKSLGVDCIWLLPFYESPLKDDGYDISDYYNILSDYGTIDDFKLFLDEAHNRNIRVIADLVLNHVSSQHPWFTESRSSLSNPKRDWFVWSDTPNKYQNVRIIFIDSEDSNWTLDPISKQYYWHRFYNHQPDLNYDNPEVRQEMKKVMRFWLDMGIDGFRCDAAPYLFEREGTSCENLPETHAFFKELRTMIDKEYPGRILLAEANQWPSDAREYLGKGDEFHMAFNFPLMPRIFIALARQDSYPIISVINDTLSIPDNASWCMFLRNHDELTLEMVTNEERDIMYLEYAKVAKMRLNLGIRRRLTPLIDSDKNTFELLHGLLFSLPGSPIIYYGDEIGMGDNIYLGDRNGVRTPMQWSFDRNAGFSYGDPEQLCNPVITNPNYHYEFVNVEAELRLPTSYLNWMRKTILVRKKFAQIFGRGTIRFLETGEKAVLAYLRDYDNEKVLCIFNLSRVAKAVQLDLREFRDFVPVEAITDGEFPPIGELPYFFTLAARTYFWLHLRAPTV